MDEKNVFFMHRIKHYKDGLTMKWDKGIEVKDSGTSEENFENAKQAYHAYMGAWAYGHDANTDYVSCQITDISGRIMEPFNETWKKAEQQEEPAAE